MFIKARWKNTENGKEVIRPTLICIDEIKQVIFIEEDKEAEIYFKGPIVIDKKGDIAYDFAKIVADDPKKFITLLEQHNLILKLLTPIT